ncbi:unnamed protein product [Oppiella nova]|uniref:Uncharacterized protein n=1 Tax=Oppiella nova TaxID=334625 RepID=A0A7R9L7F8_9ACAR|nr:unnamed protein product [Oppiella nova]CAG2156476.1 unnamed protein product [Oppiella nova]
MREISNSYRFLLAVAIIAEVTGSTFLVKSQGFTKLVPSLLVQDIDKSTKQKMLINAKKILKVLKN